MKYSKFILYLILTLIYSNIFAGSYYQIQGLGGNQYVTQADFMGRGGTAIGIADKSTINSINPAALIFVDVTRISGDFYHGSYKIKTTDNISATSNYSNLNGVKFLIPITVDKLVLSLGIKPITRNDFTSKSTGVLSTENKYEKKVTYKGGLNQFSFGLATGFMKRIYTGIFLNYNFGRIEQKWDVDFISDLYLDTSDILISEFWGGNVSGGIMVKVRSNLYIGATYSQKIELDSKKYIDYTFGLSSDKESINIQIPHSWGIGASYILKNRVRLSLDYFNQPWSELLVDNETVTNINDSYSIAGGIEFLPTSKSITSYFNTMSYRLGFNYTHLSYQDTNGNNTVEYMGTFGLGFPYYGRWGRIDVAFGLGKRGNLSKNYAEESIFKFIISISGGEKWFVRQRR